MRYLFLVLLFFAMLPSALLNAQQHIISGKVTNSQNMPLPEVSVKLLGSETGTVTDRNGLFTISLPNSTFSLAFSHIGYSTIVAAPGTGMDSLNVVLEEETRRLSEVVVSSNRKEELLMMTPVSVTALTSSKIRQMKIWNIGDLAGVVPNLSYAELGVGYQQQIAIRGVSIFSETPATATYIDGVASLDVNATGLQLMDIERVEILRGPQGTLYGRNAMAGVVSITTRKTSGARQAFSEISVGNQGLQRYGFGIRVPLTKSRLSLGLAGQYQKRHGFYTNDLSDATTVHPETRERYSLKGTPEDGIRVGDEESFYANLSFRYSASDKLTFSLSSILQKEHSLGASAYYMAAPSDVIALQKPYRFQVNDLGSHARTYLNSSLNAVYQGARFSLTNTSALQYISQSYDRIDQDLLPDNAAHGSSFRAKIGDSFPQTVLSQELRAHSSGEKRLTWTAGAYFFHQANLKQYAAVYKDLATLLGMREGTQVTQTHFYNSGSAVYGQVEYQLTPMLKATAGVRADYEHRTIKVARYYLEPDGSRDYDITDTTMKSQFGALSPKAVLQYFFSDSRHLYLSYSRGFRAGGNNLFTKGKYFSYDPEYSNNLEVGYKLQSEDRRLRATAALFYLYWINMQLDLNPEPGYWITDNVGNVSSYGAETEIAYIPVPGMQADFSLGLNKASYGNFDYLGENISGNQAILAPESTTMIGLQQLLPFSAQTGIILRGEWKRTGSQYFDLANEIHQPAYHVFNARLTFGLNKAEIAFWGQNLSGSRFLTFAMPGYFKHSVINRPRTVGITLRYGI